MATILYNKVTENLYWRLQCCSQRQQCRFYFETKWLSVINCCPNRSQLSHYLRLCFWLRSLHLTVSFVNMNLRKWIRVFLQLWPTFRWYGGFELLLVYMNVRVSFSLWRLLKVEEGSIVGFSCLSAGTLPSTSPQRAPLTLTPVLLNETKGNLSHKISKLLSSDNL